MSGIYIPGMEMPTSCFECRFSIDGFCYASGQVNIRANEERQTTNYCPLIHVPDHGRLIDAGALDAIGYCGIPQGREDTFDSGVMWLAEQIDSLPTIIPADKEGR